MTVWRFSLYTFAFATNAGAAIAGSGAAMADVVVVTTAWRFSFYTFAFAAPVCGNDCLALRTGSGAHSTVLAPLVRGIGGGGDHDGRVVWCFFVRRTRVGAPNNWLVTANWKLPECSYRDEPTYHSQLRQICRI